MTSAERMLQLLQLFTAERPTWTVEQAAPASGVSLSTAYRYVRALVRAGLLEPADGAGAYALGPAIIQLDRNLQLSEPLLRAARPTMAWLAAQQSAPSTLLLCRLYRDGVMCIHQEPSPDQRHPVSYERGLPLPMVRGAASKVILAHLPPRRLKRFFRTDAAAIAAAGLGRSEAEFRERLRAIRKAGLCIAHGELDPEVTGLAVPLLSPQGQLLGSLALACRARLEAPASARAGALLQAAGREIDARLAALLLEPTA